MNPEQFKNHATCVIINAWDTSIWTSETNKTRTRPQHECNNHRLLCDASTGSLLAYRAIWARPREREIGERDIGERDIVERDIREKDIRETVTTCQFTEQLLIHIHIQGVSGCLSFSQSWHHWSRLLQLHTPQKLLPTEAMSLESLWSWARVQGRWPWGRRQGFWPWGMLAHHLALPR